MPKSYVEEPQPAFRTGEVSLIRERFRGNTEETVSPVTMSVGSVEEV
jgi:hypothetical protein